MHSYLPATQHTTQEIHSYFSNLIFFFISSCDMYTGFLALERFYFRRFKKHIHFVVLSVDDKAKRLSAVADIAFSGQIPFSDELPLIASKIKSALELNA